MTDPMELRISHDKQEVVIYLPDDIAEISLPKAKKLQADLADIIKKLEGRGRPPCPAPFLWSGDGKEFAQSEYCSSASRLEGYDCSAGVGGKEFYIKDLVALKDWIHEVLDYHYNEGCRDLKAYEASQKKKVKK